MQLVYSTTATDLATGHLMGVRESYPSSEMQSVYSTAATDWATGHLMGVGILPLLRDAVGVFNSRNRLDYRTLDWGWESYPSSEMQSVYSTAATDWTTGHLIGGGNLTPLRRYARCILQLQPTGLQDTWWGVGNLTPLQRCSWCILQLQPTGLQDTSWGGVILPLFRDALGVFYSCNRLCYRTLDWGGNLTPLQRCSRCILQLQPTVLQDTWWGGILPLFRDAVGVFYSCNRLGYRTLWTGVVIPVRVLSIGQIDLS